MNGAARRSGCRPTRSRRCCRACRRHFLTSANRSDRGQADRGRALYAVRGARLWYRQRRSGGSRRPDGSGQLLVRRHVLDPVFERLPASARIIDPTCGSGAFLVEAFRRLVWRAAQGQPAERKLVSKVLYTQLFGIDINRSALSGRRVRMSSGVSSTASASQREHTRHPRLAQPDAPTRPPPNHARHRTLTTSA